MWFDSLRAGARAVLRSVGVFKSYWMMKRCRRCRHLLSKRALVCPHCRK